MAAATSPDTSKSLLARLRGHPSPEDWAKLTAVYVPLLHGWLGKYRLQPADLDDLVQDVLGALVTEVPRFAHNGRPGAFRHWLRVIAVYRVRNFWRSNEVRRATPMAPNLIDDLGRLEDDASELSQQWDADHDRLVVDRLLAMIEPEFAPSAWQAFLKAMAGQPAAEIAAELGITPNSVWIAKSRVLARLRQEAAGLVD